MNIAELFNQPKTQFEVMELKPSSSSDLQCSQFGAADLLRASPQLSDILACTQQQDAVLVIGSVSQTLLQAYVSLWANLRVVVPVDPKISPALLRDYLSSLPVKAVWLCCSESEASELLSQLQEIFDEAKLPLIKAGGCGQGLQSSGERPSSVDNKTLDIDSKNLESIDCDDQSQALIIFTSGSTGKPKGVVLSHGNLLAGARNIQNTYDLQGEDKALGLLPLNHINGIVTTLISPAYTGSRCAFLTGGFSLEGLQQAINISQATWINAVPFQLNQLAKTQQKLELDSTKIRFIRSASAPLNPDYIELLEQRYQIPVIESMGMSEAAGQIFSNPLPPQKHKSGFVGLPVGFEVEILSDQGTPLGANEEGEIAYRGCGLAQAYWQQGEKKMIPGEQWFRSGDLGLKDNNGYFKITGRKKDIAIFCGENIGLRSIESQLETIGFIKSVACKVEQSEDYGELIDTYIELDQALDQAQLTELQNAILPLVPSALALGHFYEIKSIPRSSAGKVLKGLMEPSLAFAQHPVTNSSHTPIAALAKLLKVDVEQLSDDSAMGNFAGWNSLVQTYVVQQIETVLERKLAPEEMMQASSIAGIKQLLASGREPKAYSRVRHLDARKAQAETETESRAIQRYIAELKEQGLASGQINYLILSASSLEPRGIKNFSLLLDGIVQEVKDGAIVMNGFTWDFCRKGYYDFESSACETGLLNELFRRRPDVVRSPHPIYSYLVFGGMQEQALQAIGEDSWGEQSFLGTLCNSALGDDCVRVISDGVSVLKGNPAIHWLEQKYKVPYRFGKLFKGSGRLADPDNSACKNNAGELRASMFVRHLDENEYVNDWSPLQAAMQNAGSLKTPVNDKGLYSYSLQALLKTADQILSQNVYGLARKK